MNYLLGWNIAEDCIGEEGYYDEDEVFVNANDPLKTEIDLDNRSEDFEDENGAYVLKSEFENYSDNIHYNARMKAIAIAGAVCQSCRQSSIDNTDTTELEEEAIDYISMEEHLENADTDKNPGIPGIAKQTPRPFEKWIQDVKAGRKTIHDSL